MNEIYECSKCHKQFKKKIYLTKHQSQKDCENISNKNNDTSTETSISSPLGSNFKSFDELSLLSINNDQNEQVIKNDNYSIELILKQQDDMMKSMKYIIEKLMILEKKFDEINIKASKNEYHIMDVKKEVLKVDENVIRQCFSQCSIDSDAELIYYYYFHGKTKDKYPIRNTQKNDYQYWNGTEWVYDKNGINLKDILIFNIKRTYRSVQTLGDLDSSKYLERQQHIENLENQKTLHNSLLDILKKTYLS
jgi:hypothetical protein